MAIETLPKLPDSLFAGDTCKVLFDNAEFPAPEWLLTLSFFGPEVFSIESEPQDDGGHLVTMAAADTATRQPGVYQWAARVENDAHERRVLCSGNLWLKPNPETGTLTYAAECLTLIEAHIKGRLPAGLSNHTIAGNVITKISIKEAEELRDKYRAEVREEQRALIRAKGGDPDALHIYFSRT
jgi:hypothetical protein